MPIAKIVILIFIALESANVLTLYFFPESRYANGIGVFKAWEKSKADPEIHRFVRYMVNWVAGTKLIFLLLLVVILLTGNQQTLRLTSVAMALAIASFFWRLFPIIREMGREDEIDPRNYPVVLAAMIAAMIAVFLISAFL